MHKYKEIFESWKKKRNQARLASLQRSKGIITAPRSAKLSRVNKALEKMGIDQPWAVQSTGDNPALTFGTSMDTHINKIRNSVKNLVSNFTPDQMKRLEGLMGSRGKIIQRLDRRRESPNVVSFEAKVKRRKSQMKPLNPAQRNRRLKKGISSILDRMPHNHVMGNPSAEPLIQPFMPEKQN